MAFSDHAASDLERRSSGNVLLPLAAELEYQRSVAKAAGSQLGRADFYVDESMPWAAARLAIGAIDLARGLVVRDAETSQLRVLQVHPYPGLFCTGSEFTVNLLIEDRRIVSEAGSALLTFDGRIDTGLLRLPRPLSDWDVAIHVVGDPPLGVVAAVIAAFDRDGCGAPNDGVRIVHLDLRSSLEVRADTYEAHRPCPRPSAAGIDDLR